jgi:dihydrofolate synthase/folylpolyglutamate synthase
MDYSETLTWMFEKLPMYQRLGKTAFKKDLTNTLELSKELGFPEQQFKSIHVGGTNGKGSVSHMLASILQTSGYKVGLYTSPHLKDFRERIKINGQEIPVQDVIDFIGDHKLFLETQQLSFFEMTVGMAFDYFAKQQVDIAIIEVGLGGRLDSTNIITPLLSVITNIGLDHMAFLGDTLEKIAGEKAGIIKQNIPVVIGETVPETKPVFLNKAKAETASIYFAKDLETELPDCDLKGSYQKNNIRTTLQAIAILNQIDGWAIQKAEIENGLANVKSNTRFQGRWEILGKRPKIIADTGHNEEGLRFVIKQLLQESYEQLHIVLGVVNDKDLDMILPLFPKEAFYYFCKPDVPRGMEAEYLQKKAQDFFLNGDVFISVGDAFKTAKQSAKASDVIFVGGSTFTVAEIL